MIKRNSWIRGHSSAIRVNSFFKKMFKNLIAPVQSWLLSQRRCVGCGVPLVKARHEKIDEAHEKVTCNCRRVYIYSLADKKYRRAKVEEV